MTGGNFTWPKVTGNSAMLAGYIIGALLRDDIYRVAKINTEEGELIIESQVAGNRYRVTVNQIGGN